MSQVTNNQGISSTPIEQIPIINLHDIPFMLILSNLPPRELISVTLTCRDVRQICSDKQLCDLHLETIKSLNWNEIKDLLKQIKKRWGIRLTVPELLSKCKNLESLDLSNAPIRTILPKIINSCKNLKRLRLYACDRITSLDIRSLKTLKELDITHCKNLKILKVEGLSNLRSLSAGSTPITSLNVAGLKSVKTIYLRECRALTILENTQDLKAIERLDCGQCTQLTTMDLQDLHQLQFLNLCSCSALTTVNLKNLTQLTEAWAPICPNLKRFNQEKLPSLQELYLYDCPDLDPINLSESPSLEKLKLTFNEHTPLNIYRLHALRELSISGNFTSLAITDLPVLHWLGCGSCDYLNSIELKNLPILREMSIGSDSLKKIDIHGLKSLRLIDIEENKIEVSITGLESHTQNIQINVADDYFTFPVPENVRFYVKPDENPNDEEYYDAIDM